MESLDPVIVELLNENVRLRGEIDRLRERLDNNSKLMLYQEGYIDKQNHEIKSLKSDKYQKPKYQKKLKEADDRHKSRLKSLEASYLYREETLRIYIENFRKENIRLVEENGKLRVENNKLRNENGKLRVENNKLRNENIKLHDGIINQPNEQAKQKKINERTRDENKRLLEKIDELQEKINKQHEKIDELQGKIDALKSGLEKSHKISSLDNQQIEKLRKTIADLKTDVYEKPAFKEMLQDAVRDYMRKLKSQKALYESKLHIQKTINKLLGKELAELKAKLSEDLNKSS